MSRRNLLSLLPLAATLFVLGACDNGSRLTVPPGAARLTVKLMDAPGDLAEAWVKVQSIQFMSGTQTNPAEELTVKNTGWIDLLTLTNGNTEDLFQGILPAGTYSQVRLVVCDMYIRTSDGQIIATPGAVLPDGVTPAAGTELKLTSQCHSGFKAALPNDQLSLDESTVNTLVIDFDAKQSFAHQAGKSGMWIVTPVLHGTVTVTGHAAPGTIAGAVAAAAGVPAASFACGARTLTADSLIKYFVPTATMSAQVHTGIMNGSNYSIGNLAPGTYTMGSNQVGFANGDSLLYTAAATPPTSAVTSNNTTTSNYSISAVACKPHA